MAERVRICDIAEELGLSTATVSNVIHGKTNRVSEATVRRVTELLEERQYIPSMAGVLLARNNSRIIGVFVNDHEKYGGHTLDDPFIASSLNSLSAEIESHGLFMMVKKAVCVEDVVQFASMWNMDGIVVIGFCEQDYALLRSRMRIPFVVYDGICQKPERFLNLTIDNVDGGQQVGRYLRDLGHDTALCLSDNDTGLDRDRLLGFCRGFAPGRAETLLVPMQKPERRAFYRQHAEDFRRVTAVFAVSDYYAADIVTFLAEEGISVPEELSVAGFDDTPICEMIRPSLTTVRQDGVLRARLAIESLQEMREGHTVPPEIRTGVTLVVRNSTAPRK